MLSALIPGTVSSVPVSLAICAVAVLLAILLLIAVVAWAVVRRVDQVDLPAALLGLAHVVSALCGLLPWGKPTPPPAFPQLRSANEEPPAAPNVVLVRGEAASTSLVQREEG
ncbi:hypothetical protein [Streptomyces sp. N2A]|uniref:hypothetical protein n=1 Tax=Streptomyces sp. N2A TaxID=3073936 RepID=UPI002870721A|nr:hypothetical protein [Streptomyces sp. N2A]